MAATQPPSITPSPSAPQRRVKASFNNMVDAFVTWLENAPAQFGAVATNVWNNAKEAYDSAVAAANWATLASDKATAAATSASGAADSVLAAAAINGATMWTSGTTYQQYQMAVSRVTLKTYRKSTTAAASTGGVTDPANDPSNWQVMGSSMQRSPRTSNTMLAARDMGGYIDITSGTFTQTFDTPSNLGAGWYCYVENSGSGDITIPASDGRSNWIMYPGEARLFQCDGTTLRSTILKPFKKDFTSTTNWVKPPGYTRFGLEMWRGGEGGDSGDGGNYSGREGGSPGQGGYAGQCVIDAAVLPSSVLVTVGAGGIGGAASLTIKTRSSVLAGASSFGSFVTVTTSTLLSGFDGGTGGRGYGINGGTFSVSPGQTPTFGGKGGDGGAERTAGANGVAPGGGGGGGGCSTTAGLPSGKGGDGARGEVRVWGVA